MSSGRELDMAETEKIYTLVELKRMAIANGGIKCPLTQGQEEVEKRCFSNFCARGDCSWGMMGAGFVHLFTAVHEAYASEANEKK